jgi:hypothetical protein
LRLFAVTSDDGEHTPDLYRETAAKLRSVAAHSDQVDAKIELLELAAQFDRLAAHADKRVARIDAAVVAGQ